MDWETLFCDVDDFCRSGGASFAATDVDHRPTPPTACRAADFQRGDDDPYRLSPQRLPNIQTFLPDAQEQHRAEFPDLVSYQRFVELMPSVLALLCGYLRSRFGSCTGIGFIDSTALAVCGNKRIQRNRVFRGTGQAGQDNDGLVLRVQIALGHQ